MKYKFYCESCKKEYEHEMSFKEYDKFKEEGFRCKICGAEMKRVYNSVPNVIYNSMGFYNTDKEIEDKQVRKIMDV